MGIKARFKGRKLVHTFGALILLLPSPLSSPEVGCPVKIIEHLILRSPPGHLRNDRRHNYSSVVTDKA